MENDIEEYLNELHVPDNAGEYEEEIKNMLSRIPEGWGRWISCSKGWFPLVIETDQKIRHIDPDYEIHQIKEKFGTLRYYYGSKFNFYSIEGKIIEDIVNSAERKSEITCELCGSHSGKMIVNRGWYKTLCNICSDKKAIPDE